MKKILPFIVLLLLCFKLEASAEFQRNDTSTVWKAGVSKVIITPKKPMWMAGYASRVHPSEGTLHDLWAKALVLEDASGKKAVLITSDLVGIPKSISDNIRDQLESRFHLSRSQIIINTSHTHSGPVLENSLSSIYPLDKQQAELVTEYSKNLVTQVVGLVGDALKAMQPVRLYSENGISRFQVNRRNNNESKLLEQTELKGPNDYAVPVLKVESIKGKLLAIAFGYACHNTVLSGYDWSGDYAGFAQLELEKEYPGTTALFFQGAGADQNPLPRRTVALAQQYGKTLAFAVSRVLKEDMRKLAPRLSTAYSEIKLPLASPPAESELVKIAGESKTYYIKAWAEMLLKKMKSGEPLERTYDYPLQVWTIGDQTLVAMGGEVVIEYAIQLKRIYGDRLFVLGYSNDVMAYIPSSTILKEGGYEGETSQMAYGLPAKWGDGIEKLILDEVMRLADQLAVPKNSGK